MSAGQLIYIDHGDHIEVVDGYIRVDRKIADDNSHDVVDDSENQDDCETPCIGPLNFSYDLCEKTGDPDFGIDHVSTDDHNEAVNEYMSAYQDQYDAFNFGKIIDLVKTLKRIGFIKEGGGEGGVYLTMAAQILMRKTIELYDWSSLKQDTVDFHPFIQALFAIDDEIVEKMIVASSRYSGFSQCAFSVDTARPMINFLQAYLDAANTKSVATSVDNRMRRVRKNEKSIVDHCTQLLSRHLCLIVIRVDLGYRASLADGARNHVSSTEAAEHRRMLIASMKMDYPFMVGFVWKLEYGYRKGYHCRCIFYFNDNEVRQDCTIYLDLNRHWRLIVGEKRGVTYLCNIRIGKYYFPTTDKVNYSDKEKIESFKYLAKYLMKIDYFGYAKIAEERLFGKSKISELPTKR